tara:strand:- start:69 stop:701 length:633 start_codon:yes stop_codon:yes gene_type:complete
MANTDSWLKKDMMIAGAYDEYKPDKWEREYIDDTYKKLKEPAGKDPAEVYEQLKLPLDLVQGLKIRKGDQLPDGSVYPTPVISGEDGIDKGIGPTKEEADFIRKYLGDLPLQANINNPRMDIFLPFAVEDDSSYGDAEGTPEEIKELEGRGWSSRPNKKNMTIANKYRSNKAGNVDEVWDLTGPKEQGPLPPFDDKLKRGIQRAQMLIKT